MQAQRNLGMDSDGRDQIWETADKISVHIPEIPGPIRAWCGHCSSDLE
jgi:hypothetical protein